MIKAPLDSNLDILRSIAVLAVFVCHLLQVLAGCKFGERFAYGIETYSLGQIGVVIFFVHTSVVLMQSMERTRMSGWTLARYFYIRRAFRIYPLSVCLIIIAAAFSIPANPLGVTFQWQGVRWFLANILLIQNIGNIGSISSPLWSLPYEVQMYLVLPILFLRVRAPKGNMRLLEIYLLSLFLSRLHPLLRFTPCFLAGVIAYRLLGALRPRLPSWFWFPSVIGVMVIYVASPYAEVSWLKDILACGAVGALIPLFRKSSGAAAAVAAHIAKYSYGIYLCHLPILWLVYRKLAIPSWQRPIWLALAMCTVPVLCYRLIELPLIQIGTRVARRAPVIPAAAAPAGSSDGSACANA
jgi:peptidoglycan/LPS O-acetylase OafA/YrhL